MHKTLFRSYTRCLSIEAHPETVFDFVGDGHNLPEWAPDFATAVEHEEAELWLITSVDGRFPIRLVVDRAARTIDFVSPAGDVIGAFARVIPNGRGSELMFTLMLPTDTPEPEVATRTGTVDAELERVRVACETVPATA